MIAFTYYYIVISLPSFNQRLFSLFYIFADKSGYSFYSYQWKLNKQFAREAVNP